LAAPPLSAAPFPFGAIVTDFWDLFRAQDDREDVPGLTWGPEDR
jgi:hypothetical protein